MELKVNEELCVGCGLCASQYPQVMELNPEKGCAQVKNEIDTEVDEEEVLSICPMGAIEKENE